MKVAVIGANGQLGSDICQTFQSRGHEVIALNHDTFEVSNTDVVSQVLRNISPDLVVNTAAMHNVEACEENPALSFAVNAIGPKNLALASNEMGFVLVHISTDYVFDGTKQSPYVETDTPSPLNVYGNTKLSGELFVRSIARKYFVLRVSGLYGMNPCRAKGGRNFVTLMLDLAKKRDEVHVVDDEVLTPTFTQDVARQILHLSQVTDYGLYHVAAQGGCSWYGFARKIFALTNSSVRLAKAAPGEFPTKVPRPKYSVLENRALQSVGLDIMPHWSSSLERFLNLVRGENG